eukprot:1157887-Pelagomonas_calceolata.AAC.12
MRRINNMQHIVQRQLRRMRISITCKVVNCALHAEPCPAELGVSVLGPTVSQRTVLEMICNSPVTRHWASLMDCCTRASFGPLIPYITP